MSPSIKSLDTTALDLVSAAAETHLRPTTKGSRAENTVGWAQQWASEASHHDKKSDVFPISCKEAKEETSLGIESQAAWNMQSRFNPESHSFSHSSSLCFL